MFWKASTDMWWTPHCRRGRLTDLESLAERAPGLAVRAQALLPAGQRVAREQSGECAQRQACGVTARARRKTINSAGDAEAETLGVQSVAMATVLARKNTLSTHIAYQIAATTLKDEAAPQVAGAS